MSELFMVGVDLAKRVFQLHVITQDGAVLLGHILYLVVGCGWTSDFEQLSCLIVHDAS